MSTVLWLNAGMNTSEGLRALGSSLARRLDVVSVQRSAATFSWSQ